MVVAQLVTVLVFLAGLLALGLGVLNLLTAQFGTAWPLLGLGLFALWGTAVLTLLRGIHDHLTEPTGGTGTAASDSAVAAADAHTTQA